MAKKKNSLFKSIVIILILAIVSGGAIYLFTNKEDLNLETEIVALKLNDLEITNNAKDVTLGTGYLSFAFKGNALDYTPTFNDIKVKIVPNKDLEEKLDFSHSGIIADFRQESDLTRGFSIKIEKDKIFIDGNKNLQSVLSKIFEDEEVIILDNSTRENLFKFEMTYDNGKSFSFTFSNKIPIENIVLDKETIVF